MIKLIYHYFAKKGEEFPKHEETKSVMAVLVPDNLYKRL